MSELKEAIWKAMCDYRQRHVGQGHEPAGINFGFSPQKCVEMIAAEVEKLPVKLEWKPGPPDLEGVPDGALYLCEVGEGEVRCNSAGIIKAAGGPSWFSVRYSRHIGPILPVEPEPKVPGCPVCYNPMWGTGGLYWHCNDCDLRWSHKAAREAALAAWEQE